MNESVGNNTTIDYDTSRAIELDLCQYVEEEINVDNLLELTNEDHGEIETNQDVSKDKEAFDEDENERNCNDEQNNANENDSE